jgi:hypothetical protein
VARRLLVTAAEWHEDVVCAVRLAAADESDRLAVLKAAVDDGLRTRRHLDYWGSSSWARDASPVVDALAGEVATEPSAELVVLLQRAAGHLVKVIMRADDSNGMIGDLVRQVLDLHREACVAPQVVDHDIDVGGDPAERVGERVRRSFDQHGVGCTHRGERAEALGARRPGAGGFGARLVAPRPHEEREDVQRCPLCRPTPVRRRPSRAPG